MLGQATSPFDVLTQGLVQGIVRQVEPVALAMTDRLKPIISEEIRKNMPSAATIFGISVGAALIAGLLLGGWLYRRKS